MYRFHPQWQLVLDRLRDGAIGELRLVRSVFTFTVSSPENVRRQADIGGGAERVGDRVCLNASRWTMGAEPVAVSATMSLGPEGIDEEFARAARLRRRPAGP